MFSIRKKDIRNLTILLGSTTLVLGTAGLAPALPGMASAYQDVPGAGLLVGLVLTMPALLGAISAPFAGILTDRWGRKPLIVAALILYGLSGTAGFVLDSLISILLSRAILGLAMASLANGFVTLLADYFSGARLNRFSGYLGAFAGFGGMTYQITAGYLADLSWRLPFLIHLIAFVILLGVVFTVDEPILSAQSSTSVRPGDRTAAPLSAILTIYSIGLMGMVLLFTAIIYVPFYLTTFSGASNSQVGLALSIQALPGGLIALFYSRFKNRYTFQGISGLVFLNLGISHIVAALTQRYDLILVGLFVGGLGFGMLVPNLISWLATITPPPIRGRVMGGFNFAIFLGQFITPLITRPVIDHTSIAGTFGLAGGVSILLAVLLIGGRQIQSIKKKLISTGG